MTASLDADSTPYADQVANFTVDVFDAVGATTVKWVVDCPSATPYDFSNPTASGTAKTFSTTFTTVGEHSLCVYVEDAGGPSQADSDRITFQINDEVDPGPTAGLVVSPASAKPGDVITFDASSSVNAVPGPLKYEFDADGDSSNGYEVDNGNNPIYQRTYAQAFNGSVGVSVTSRNSRSGSRSVQLLVTPPAVFGPGPGGSATPISSPLGDGPLGAVKFTNEPCTINQFLVSGLSVRMIWGDVFGKAEVTYYLLGTKKVKKKGKKTKTVTTRTKIVSAKDETFYSPGSGFTRAAPEKTAKVMRKLKSAKVLVAWKVTSKKGDFKKGEVTVSMKKGL